MQDGKIKDKIAIENTYISIVTKNGKQLNSPIKRQSRGLNQNTKPIKMLLSGDTRQLQGQRKIQSDLRWKTKYYKAAKEK